MKTFTLYGTSTCVQCKGALRYAHSKGLDANYVMMDDWPPAEIEDHLSNFNTRNLPLVEVRENAEIIERFTGFVPAAFDKHRSDVHE